MDLELRLFLSELKIITRRNLSSPVIKFSFAQYECIQDDQNDNAISSLYLSKIQNSQ